MSKKKILMQVQNNEISSEEAYEKLYRKEPKGRASFVKLSIKALEESKGTNRLLSVLFFLPVPIVFVRWALRFVGKELTPMERRELVKIINHAKGTRVQVLTAKEDVKVNVKIY